MVAAGINRLDLFFDYYIYEIEDLDFIEKFTTKPRANGLGGY
jgi:hypothetical protein